MAALPGSVTRGSERSIYEALTGNFTPLGYRQITTGFTAVMTLPTIPATTPNIARLAKVQNNTDQVLRYRDDATDPSATVGMKIAPGSTLDYDGTLSALRFIAVASPTAGGTIDISYYV